MSLRNDEILRVKYECGFNVVSIGAEAYALEGYVALFDRAIQPYLIDLQTTSSTVVTAASSGASVVIALASNPAIAGNTVQPLAFVAGSNVVVDLGPTSEVAAITYLSGLNATMTLFNAHGTASAYQIVVQGAEATIRDILARLDQIRTEMLSVAPKTAGIAAVDEVRLHAATRGSKAQRGKFDDLVYQRLTARRDLCGALGIPYLPDARRGSSLSYEPY